jgi:hypothetical protein
MAGLEDIGAGETQEGIGIIREFGDLAADTVLDEAALAKVFGRHRVSIKRAVERGELPPPVRLLGCPVWTIQAIRDHMAHRLEQAKREAERMNRKIAQLGA